MIIGMIAGFVLAVAFCLLLSKVNIAGNKSKQLEIVDVSKQDDIRYYREIMYCPPAMICSGTKYSSVSRNHECNRQSSDISLYDGIMGW